MTGAPRSPENLRQDFDQTRYVGDRPEINTLGRVVLGSIEDVLIHETHQVVYLVQEKMYDTVGACDGRTQICIQRIDE